MKFNLLNFPIYLYSSVLTFQAKTGPGRHKGAYVKLRHDSEELGLALREQSSL